MTFAEARAFFRRVDPDSKDPLVQGVISTVCAQGDILKALWHSGGADEAAPTNPAIGGRRFITEETAAQLDRIAADAKRGADAAERAEKAATESNALIRAHVAPRPGDCAVTQQEMADILARLDMKGGKRQIVRWEKYLKTDGREGTKPPEGYTLQTRLTLQSATAWAKYYAAHEKSKLNVKVSFEKLTRKDQKRLFEEREAAERNASPWR